MMVDVVWVVVAGQNTCCSPTVANPITPHMHRIMKTSAIFSRQAWIMFASLRPARLRKTPDGAQNVMTFENIRHGELEYWALLGWAAAVGTGRSRLLFGLMSGGGAWPRSGFVNVFARRTVAPRVACGADAVAKGTSEALNRRAIQRNSESESGRQAVEHAEPGGGHLQDASRPFLSQSSCSPFPLRCLNLLFLLF